MPLVVSTVYPDAAPAVRAARRRRPRVPRDRLRVARARRCWRASPRTRPHRSAAIFRRPAAALAGAPTTGRRARLLAAAGLTWSRPGASTRTPGRPLAAAQELGYPVALKALGLLHKSDAGGCGAWACGDAAAVAAAAGRPRGSALRPPGLRRRADGAARRRAIELIVGCRRDAPFGPLALVGCRRRLRRAAAATRARLWRPLDDAEARRACSTALRAAAAAARRPGRPRARCGRRRGCGGGSEPVRGRAPGGRRGRGQPAARAAARSGGPRRPHRPADAERRGGDDAARRRRTVSRDDIAGKRVLVTAAATGIGATIAARFAQAGARGVHVRRRRARRSPPIWRRTLAIARAAGRRRVSRPTWTRFVAAGVARLGGLDVLVSNAGVAGPAAPVEEMDVGRLAAHAGREPHRRLPLRAARRCRTSRPPAAGPSPIMSSNAGTMGLPFRGPVRRHQVGSHRPRQDPAMELGPARHPRQRDLPRRRRRRAHPARHRRSRRRTAA